MDFGFELRVPFVLLATPDRVFDGPRLNMVLDGDDLLRLGVGDVVGRLGGNSSLPEPDFADEAAPVERLGLVNLLSVDRPDLDLLGVAAPGVLAGVDLPVDFFPAVVLEELGLVRVDFVGEDFVVVGWRDDVAPVFDFPLPDFPGVVAPDVDRPGMDLPVLSWAREVLPGVVLPGGLAPVVDRPGTDLPDLSLPRVVFPGLVFPGVAFSRVVLPGVVFPGEVLPRVDFPGVVFPGVAAPRVAVPGVDLPDRL